MADTQFRLRIMWRTSQGTRCLVGAEAELVRSIIGHLADEIDLTCRLADVGFECGVPAFNSLHRVQQIAMIAEVGEALLSPTSNPPELTAISEATVYALFAELHHCVDFDLDLTGPDSESYWRPLIHAAAVENGFDDPDDPMPPPSSDDLESWHVIIESLADRILWDRDWDLESTFVDEPPERSHAINGIIGIEDDYFQGLASDPTQDELDQIRSRIDELTAKHDRLP